jgi:hypothetical protein
MSGDNLVASRKVLSVTSSERTLTDWPTQMPMSLSQLLSLSRDQHERLDITFPHRPGGGFCRYPDPPAVRWQDAHRAKVAAPISLTDSLAPATLGM